MSTTLILACLWVLGGTIVAFLPMRWQYLPGFALLLAAPVLIIMLGIEHGLWVAVVAALGFVSMFRRPLVHLGRKAFGAQRPARPSDRKEAP